METILFIFAVVFMLMFLVGINLMMLNPVRAERENDYGTHSLYYTEKIMNNNYRYGSIMCYSTTVLLTLLAFLVTIKLAIPTFIVLILGIFVASRRKVY